jgi:hypothetical protein
MSLEDRLRDSLVQRAGRVHAPPSAWEEVETGLERRRGSRRSRAATGLFALALAGAAIALLVLAFASLRQGRSTPRPAAPAATPSLVRTLVLPSVPTVMTAGEGYIWVGVPAQDATTEDSLVRIDPRTYQTNEIILPTELSSLAVGGGRVWGTGIDRQEGWSLYAIDPSSGSVVIQVAGLGGPVAVADGSIWTGVRTGDETTSSSLARVDPATGAVLKEFSIGRPIDALGFDGTNIWVFAGPPDSNGNSGEAVKIDPGSDTVLGQVSIDEAMPAMAVGTNFVWVSTGGAQPVRIDAATMEVETLGDLPEGFMPFAVDDAGVWFSGGRSGETVLEHIDASTGSVDASIALNQPLPMVVPQPLVLDASENSIWTGNQDASASQISLGPAPTPS